MNAPKEYGCYTENGKLNAQKVVLELVDGDHPDWNEYELHYTDEKTGKDVTVETGDVTSERHQQKPAGASGQLVRKKKQDDTGSHPVIIPPRQK